MKPPIVYYGGKATLAPRIAALLPPHQHYVEPFAGSLAVLLAKHPSRLETVNDLDQEVMTFWRVLRDRPADLERMCALTPHARAELAAACEPVPDNHPDPELEVARRVWVRLMQGRTARLRRTGWRFRIDPTGIAATSGELANYVDRMAAVAERLAHVSLECRPALEVIESHGQHPDVLLYVDPPYLGSTRNLGYRHEMGADSEHRDLAKALHAARATVVLSGYPSPLYDIELYPGWERIEFSTQTKQGDTASARTEVLWSNRPLAVADRLFDGDLGGAA